MGWSGVVGWDGVEWWDGFKLTVRQEFFADGSDDVTQHVSLQLDVDEFREGVRRD